MDMELKNSWGQIRTVDLSGMSRTLSPTELPSHVIFLFSCQFLLVALTGMSRALSPAELPCHKSFLFTCMSILPQTSFFIKYFLNI